MRRWTRCWKDTGMDETSERDVTGAGEHLTVAITLRSGTQLRFEVKRASVSRTVGGKLAEISLTDDDTMGAHLAYVDIAEVAAVHYEREPR